MSVAARILHRLVRAYQYVFAARPSPCRYVPSCSNYALDALESHGALSGGWLATRRICRCHPWGGHGWDPVPERVVSPQPVTAAGRGQSADPRDHRCSI